jgi:hypothetical protein
MKTRWTLSCLIWLPLGLSVTDAQEAPIQAAPPVSSMPGAPLGPDPFRITFDEFGTGFYQVFNSTTGQYGPIVSDPGAVVGGFLRFLLPEAVGLGDVGIAGPREGETCSATNFGSCSDGVRVIFDNGSYYTQYSSDLPLGEVEAAIPLADTGFPADFAPTAFINETGTPDVLETFLYVAGPMPQTPANSNFYNGVSDGRIPEPATIALLCAALFGLGAARRRFQHHFTIERGSSAR